MGDATERPLADDAVVHRMDGASVANLTLQDRDTAIEPPGLSVLAGGTPAEAATQMRRALHMIERWGSGRPIMVASATVGEVRSAGFDVIPWPTRRLSNHARIVHPDGADGFAADDLIRLSRIFHEIECQTMSVDIPPKSLLLTDSSGTTLGRVVDVLSDDRGIGGRLEAEQTFNQFRPLFEQWEHAAENQQLVAVDELDGRIEALGLMLNDNGVSVPLADVHVLSGDRFFAVPAVRKPPAATPDDDPLAKIAGRRTRVTRWVAYGPLAVAVELEAIIPDGDPSEPCCAPSVLSLLKDVRRHAEAGDVAWLRRHGRVYRAVDATADAA